MSRFDYKKITANSLIGILLAGSFYSLISAKSTHASDTYSPESITLSGTLRDFKGHRDTNGNISGGHEDFERKKDVDTTPNNGNFKYGLDLGITTDTISADKKPVYAGGSFSTTTQENFDQWYRDVAGVNESMSHDITLTKQSGSNIYTFDNGGDQFFPLDNLLMGNEGRSHNYHFTYEIHTKFTYAGGETFNFSGDDDVWVYIDGKKVIDIGGVHGKQHASVDLDSLGLTEGETYELDFFFAERHTTKSNFKIETTITFLPSDAVDDVITTDEDNAITENILANDTNPNNDMSVTKMMVDVQGQMTEYAVGEQITMPSGALLTVQADGTLDYDPNGQFESFSAGDSAQDIFTYTATDGYGIESTAQVILNINGVADAPVAKNNSAETTENEVKWSAVLRNDTDPDSPKEELKITAINGQSVTDDQTVTLDNGATVRVNLVRESKRAERGRNALRYDPTPSAAIQFMNDGDTYVETIEYTVEDAEGLTDTGEFEITVTGITDTFAD